MIGRAAAIGLGWLALSASPAAAQISEQSIVNDAIARACQDRAGLVIPAERVARAMLVAARLNDLDGPSTAAAMDAIDARANLFRGARALIQEQLATAGSDQAKALAVTPAPPPRVGPNPPEWLFGSTGYELRCAAARPPRAPAFASVGPVAVRGSIDELDDIGDARRSAGAARIGWERVRVTNLAGETKRTNALSIDATLGLAIPGSNTDRFGFAFVDYSRNRVRTRNSGSSTVGGSANDVDALELGLLGTARPAAWLRATGRIGVTFDRITDARYLRGGATFVPITGGEGDLGPCGFNIFRAIGGGLEARCTAAAEADIRYVLRRGSAQIGASDTLLALGGVIGAEFRRELDLNNNPQNGLVGNVSYRYLRLLDGIGPDVDRLEASLSYRWWAGTVGFDLGFNYVDGTERKSLSDEHRLGVRFGIIY